jgi:Skp family chaperone for outer membrane proteins
MKSILTAVASGVVGAVVSATMVAQAQPTKTPSAAAYISSNRLFTESTQGRAEATRIQTLQRQRAAELRTKAQALEATRQQLASATDPGARTQLAQQEQQQRADLERSTQQAQIEMQNLQREVDADLRRRVRAVLDEMMKTQNYQLVLNSDIALMWAAPELDLTAPVIAKMNGQ